MSLRARLATWLVESVDSAYATSLACGTAGNKAGCNFWDSFGDWQERRLIPLARRLDARATQAALTRSEWLSELR